MSKGNDNLDEIIDNGIMDAMNQGWIIADGKNEHGHQKFRITEKGKKHAETIFKRKK